jgi:phosphatidylglycerol lysyltransferase
VGAVLLVAALLFLRNELRSLSFLQIADAVRNLPGTAVAIALLLTALNYTVLTGYDQLAFVYLGRRFPWWQISVASFVGYAISNSLGFALLSGTTARYRFYARWGLTTAELSRIVVFYSGTFWLGLMVLGGWGLVAYPPSGYVLAVPIGVLMLAVSAAYAIASFVVRGPVRLLGFELAIPSPRLVAGQFALSIADWALAVAVLWVLLPTPRVPFVELTGAFVVAQIFGLASNIPAGLGIFEGSLIVLVGPAVPMQGLLAALLLFRVIYYLLPLAVALLVLLVDESYERRHIVQRWGHTVGTLTITIAPKLVGAFTFLGGAILLFSGATPAAPGRLTAIAQILPDPLVELSHFLGSLIGLGLLLISQALARRVDAAWTLAVGLLVAGIATSLFKGFDYEEATLLSLFLLLVIAARHEFDRRATLFEHTFSPLWLSGVLLVVLAAGVLGGFAFSHLEYSNQSFWQFGLAKEGPRFLRSMVGVSVVLLVVGMRQLLRPSAPPLQRPDAAALTDAGRVIAAQRSTSAYLAYLGDKGLVWSEDRSAFLMYGVRGRTWVALHDPVGSARAVPELIRRFLDMADDADGVPVFYQVRKDYLHHYADFGLAFAKAGEEAIVPLDTFSLDGGARKKMRFTFNKLTQQGATMRVVPAAEVSRLLPALRQVSDEWLKLKGTSEKGFSLGFFDDGYLARFPVAVMEVGGRIEAFASLWPGPGKAELSVDLMRHRPSAPENAMEGLLIFVMQWGRSEGYHCFNLGMAPLSGLEATHLAPIYVKVASYLYRYGRPFYNFKGLRAYKEKFHPVWEPRYLAYPGGLSLPRVLTDVSALIAGGYRGILLR